MLFELDKVFDIVKISDSHFLIKCTAPFADKSELELSYTKINNDWFLTDNKSTLKYMNKAYELTAADVKLCITNILKLYDFKMFKGEILCRITNSSMLKSNILSFIQCVSQLANMYIFFDKP